MVGNLETLSFSQSAGFGGPFTRAELAKRKIGSFAVTCNGYSLTQDLLFKRYQQLAKIFDVRAKARAQIKQINRALAATARTLLGQTPVPTFIYIDGKGPLQTLGTPLEKAGGKNIVNLNEGGCCPRRLSVETIIGRDPQAILITSFGGTEPGGPTFETKKATLKSVLEPTTAIRNNKFLKLDFIAFNTPFRRARDNIAVGRFLHPDLKFPKFP